MPVAPDMKYEAKVVDAFIGESKTKKTPFIYFLFDTDDGKIEHQMYVTPGTLERLKETMLDTFGCTAEDLAQMAGTQDWAKLIGQNCSITTIDEEYEGDNGTAHKVKVQWVNPIAFKPQKLDVSATKRVAGLFSGGPVSSPAYSNRATGPAPAWAGAPTDDDVPF